MRKILINEITGEIISAGERKYNINEDQILLDITEDLGYNSNISKKKQKYENDKIKEIIIDNNIEAK